MGKKVGGASPATRPFGRRTRRRLGIMFAIGVFALAALAAGLRTYEILSNRDDYIKKAQGENLALVNTVERYLVQAALFLNHNIDHITAEIGKTNDLSDPSIDWRELFRHVLDSAILEVDVAENDGVIVRSSNPGLEGGRYRDLALLAKARTSDGIVFGGVSVCTNCAAPYVFRVAKRLLTKDGTIHGVIVARINPERLQLLSGTLGNSFGGNVRLLLDDGTVLFSEPPMGAGPGQAIDKDDPLYPAHMLDKSGATRVLPWDHHPDLITAYKHLPDYGLTLSVSRQKRVVLAPWRDMIWQAGFNGLVVLIACGIGAALFTRALMLHAADEERANAHKAELESIQSSAKVFGLRWYASTDTLIPLKGAADALGIRISGRYARVKDLLGLFPREEAQALHDALVDCLRTGTEHRLELTAIKEPGKPVSPTYAFTTFRHEGSSPGRPTSGHHAFIVCQDITEWHEMRTQHAHLMKMDAVGQITGGVAHDFNNLLVIILGNIEEISEAFPKDDPRSALLDVTLGAAMQARELTKRLLAFARKQPLRPTSVDVGALVEGMGSLLKRTIGEHIVLSLDEDPGSKPWNVLADRSQLEFAILNLVINARDALGPGGNVTIRVRNRVIDSTELVGTDDIEPGEYVDIMIEDNGSGMSPEVAARAIEPYFSTKPPGVGSGLGLSQVYGFVKQSGGHFRIHSEPGKGTIVHMYLPRAKAGTAELLQSDTFDAGFEFGTETILVVEDDEAVRSHIDRVLTSLGYKVLSRIDGRSALKLADEGVHFDLLLTDVMLPGGMNGVQVAAELRKRRPDLPVLYVSGYAKDIVDSGLGVDADLQFLQKPFLRGELGRKVRAALSNWHEDDLLEDFDAPLLPRILKDFNHDA